MHTQTHTSQRSLTFLYHQNHSENIILELNQQNWNHFENEKLWANSKNPWRQTKDVLQEKKLLLRYAKTEQNSNSKMNKKESKTSAKIMKDRESRVRRVVAPEVEELTSLLGRELGVDGSFRNGAVLVVGDAWIVFELVTSENKTNVWVEVKTTRLRARNPEQQQHVTWRNAREGGRRGRGTDLRWMRYRRKLGASLVSLSLPATGR